MTQRSSCGSVNSGVPCMSSYTCARNASAVIGTTLDERCDGPSSSSKSSPIAADPSYSKSAAVRRAAANIAVPRRSAAFSSSRRWVSSVVASAKNRFCRITPACSWATVQPASCSLHPSRPSSATIASSGCASSPPVLIQMISLSESPQSMTLRSTMPFSEMSATDTGALSNNTPSMLMYSPSSNPDGSLLTVLK